MTVRVSRRDVLRVLGWTAACGIVMRARDGWAQAPAPPQFGASATGPEDPSNKTISLQSYEEFLRSLQEAAKKLATEGGQTLTPEQLKRIDDDARSMFKERGYQIPLPPSGLRIE